MKSRYPRLLLWMALAAMCLSARTFAAEPVQVRVLSWNLHHGESVDGVLDLERIATVINDVRPDVVALQEVAVLELQP